MKEKIIDLGMHPYADTFISKDQLNLSEPVFLYNAILIKRILKLNLVLKQTQMTGIISTIIHILHLTHHSLEITGVVIVRT